MGRLSPLDDELMKTAQEYTGLTEKSAVLREAPRALIQREAERFGVAAAV